MILLCRPILLVSVNVFAMLTKSCIKTSKTSTEDSNNSSTTCSLSFISLLPQLQEQETQIDPRLISLIDGVTTHYNDTTIHSFPQSPRSRHDMTQEKPTERTSHCMHQSRSRRSNPLPPTPGERVSARLQCCQKSRNKNFKTVNKTTMIYEDLPSLSTFLIIRLISPHEQSRQDKKMN